MTRDARGLPMTAQSDAEVASIDWFTTRLARIDRGAEAILEDAKSFPGSPMIQLAAAAFCLFGQTAAADDAAGSYLKAAQPLLASATERERDLRRALALWARKDHLGAVAALEDLTRRWPRDLLAVKIAEFLYYVLGQQHEGARFRAHMARLADANPDDPDFLATYAFAQELCGDVDGARRTVDRALEIEPRNPWAHHCVAHIYLRRDEQHDGVRVLESFVPIWMSVGRVIHCHNAWHLGVACLAEFDRARALDVFARHVWGITPDLVVEQADAIALLWRLEMAGEPIDEFWPELADRVQTHVEERYMPFLDAHFAFALARAGRIAELEQLRARVAERSARGDAEATRSWAPVGRALIEACAAFARGDAARSAALLDPVMPNVTVVGGSDAQVDLFRQTYLRSLLDCGRKADARAYWTAATAGKTLTPLDRQWLSMAA
jgi:tetratricopeptide (TPR) repeat protein